MAEGKKKCKRRSITKEARVQEFKCMDEDTMSLYMWIWKDLRRVGKKTRKMRKRQDTISYNFVDLVNEIKEDV